MASTIRQAVLDAARRPEVRHAVNDIYIDLQKQIDLRRPVCVASGRCCRFEEFGHRLFVTTIELAAFVHDLPHLKNPLPDASSWNGQGCPYQVSKLCHVHSIRPFGCRIFFCDPAATEWQNEQYEQFHARLKKLHDQFAIPYFYLEWRQALTELALPDEPLSLEQK